MKFECQSWSYNHDTELTVLVLYYVDKAPSGFCLFRFKITVKIFFKVGFFLFSNFFQTYTVPDVYHIHFRSKAEIFTSTFQKNVNKNMT